MAESVHSPPELNCKGHLYVGEEYPRVNQSFLASDFVDAFEQPSVTIRIPHLALARPKLDPHFKRPQPVTGNFAAVFRLETSDGKEHAAKCFLCPSATLEKRYEAVSGALKSISKDWMVAFNYYPNAILVRGKLAPLLSMEWVTNTPFLEFVEQNLTEPNKLKKLARDLRRAIGDLENAGMAHGDLQHGNILIAKGGKLRLVDYDGMFVPGLENLTPSENGHRNYQSPKRKPSDYGPQMDRFSGWVISLSLLALAEAPDLWHELRRPGDEGLIFQEANFNDPHGTARILRSRGIHALDGIANKFINLCTWRLSNLPPMDRWDRLTRKPTKSVPSSSPTPDWMKSTPPASPSPPQTVPSVPVQATVAKSSSPTTPRTTVTPPSPVSAGPIRTAPTPTGTNDVAVALLLLLFAGVCIGLVVSLCDLRDVRTQLERVQAQLATAGGGRDEEISSLKGKILEVASEGPVAVEGIEIWNSASPGKKFYDGAKAVFHSSDIRYIYWLMHASNRLAGIKDLKGSLGIKMIEPNGTLSKGGSGPEESDGIQYTYFVPCEISDREDLECGWGSETGGSYEPGLYRIEFWYNSRKIAKREFTVY